MGKKFVITEDDRNRIRGLYEQQVQVDPEDQQFDNVLSQAGIVLSPDEKMELEPECPIEEPPAQYAEIVNQIKAKLETMDLPTLTKTLSQVKSLIGKKPQATNEQLAPVIIAGIAVPGVAVAVVAGLIALIIVVKIAKLIFRKGRRHAPACKRRRKLVRKFGIDGNFM